MTHRLHELYERFDRADQENKRKLGKYLHDHPGRWVHRQELVENFDIDESGISRHIEALHDTEFIASKVVDGQRVARWEGRGAGGIEYWVRQVVPSQIWSAGNELRPLLTIESLGGAYIPTLLFAGLVITGFFSAILSVFISYLPSNSAFGLTVADMVFSTGMITILASTIFVLIPIARLLDKALHRAWNFGMESASREQSKSEK